jgi:hypothetical protein
MNVLPTGAYERKLQGICRTMTIHGGYIRTCSKQLSAPYHSSALLGAVSIIACRWQWWDQDMSFGGFQCEAA